MANHWEREEMLLRGYLIFDSDEKKRHWERLTPKEKLLLSHILFDVCVLLPTQLQPQEV